MSHRRRRPEKEGVEVVFQDLKVWILDDGEDDERERERERQRDRETRGEREFVCAKAGFQGFRELRARE